MSKQRKIRWVALIVALGILIAIIDPFSFWSGTKAQWQMEQSDAQAWAAAIGVAASAGGVREVSLADLSTVDRCVTCHVNADRPTFQRDAEIAWLEKQGASVPGFWETWAGKLSPGSIGRARQFRRPLMEQVLGDLPAEMGTMLAEQYRRGLIADRAKRGMGQLDPSPVLLGHPAIAGKHPWAEVGCTGCHEGSGETTDFVAAAHSARAMWVDANTGSPVLAEELVGATQEDVEMRPEAGYVDPVTGNTGTAISQRDYWEKSYPSANKLTLSEVYSTFARPMLRLSHVEASCARCHAEIYDVKPAASELSEGRRLFGALGCADCHAAASRKVGPDLRHIGEKLTEGAVVDWVLHPRGAMPPIGLSEDEARRIADYLFGNSTAVSLVALPAGISGDAERGKMLFSGHHLDDPQALARHLPVGLKAGLGCVACHAMGGDATSYGPNLGGGQFAVEGMVVYLAEGPAKIG